MRMRSAPGGPPSRRIRRSTTAVPSSLVPVRTRPLSELEKGCSSGSSGGLRAARATGRAAGRGGENAASTPAGVPARRAQPRWSGPCASHSDERRRRRAGSRPRRRPRAPGDTSAAASRPASATSTASTHAAVSSSIHGAFASEPVPRPWSTATGPARVGEPVHAAPCPVAEATADEARDHEREQDVGRERAQAEPQRSVRRAERDERRADPDGRERVEEDGRDVDGEQREREQRQGPVGGGDRVARRSGRSPAAQLADPQDEARGEQHERHRARAAARVPERRRTVSGGEDHAASSSHGQPAIARTCPSRRTSRAGMRRSCSHAGASRVEHDRRGARDVRVDARPRGDAGRAPATLGRQAVAGSMMWCAPGAPAADRDARRRQPAGADHDRLARAAPGPELWLSVTRTGQPAARRRTGDRDVAAEAHEHAGVVRRPLRPRTRRGRRRVPSPVAPRSRSHRRVEADASTARDRSGSRRQPGTRTAVRHRARRGAGRAEQVEVAVVAGDARARRRSWDRPRLRSARRRGPRPRRPRA